MKMILHLARFAGAKFVFSAALGLAAGIGGSVAIKTINDAIHGRSGDPAVFVSTVTLAILAFAACSLVSTRLLQEIIQDLVLHLTLDISGKLAAAPYAGIEDSRERIFNVLTRDIVTMSTTIERIPNFLVAVALSGGCAAYLVVTSPRLALTLGLIPLAVFAVLRSMSGTLTRRALETRAVYDAYVRKTTALVFGLRELYQHSAHKRFYLDRAYRPVLDARKTAVVNERVAIQVSDKMAESLALFGLAMVIAIAAGRGGLEPSAPAFTLALFIIGPFTSIASFIQTLKPFNVALLQVQRLGIELDLLRREVRPGTDESYRLPIHFDDVVFTYLDGANERPFSIGPISARIEPGTITFITGGNGSGKTTLGKVMTGLYGITSGSITCDGRPLPPEQTQGYRDLFSVIWNDHQIFENVGYTKWDAQPCDALLRRMGLHDTTSLDNGVYSNVKLSSGQLKRLALVSALLEDRPVLFFDEWAANQDIQFKDVFYGQILPELKARGKTIVAITHDDRYFAHADQVIRLVNGRVDERYYGPGPAEAGPYV